MFRGRSSLVVLAATLLIGLFLAGAVYGCVGARPLAMGGAFVAVADDVNATYWNPAGLVQLPSAQGTWMHTLTNRDEINYQDYAAVAGPVGPSVAIGGSWIKSNMVIDLGAGPVINTQNWYWASVGARVAPNFSIGANLRKVDDDIDGLDSGTAFDLCLFGKVAGNWSLGLLVQNANEPDLKAGGVTIANYVRNWRPGIAYRPDSTSVFAFDIYDLSDDADARSYRLGYEKKIATGWAARIGWYGISSDNAQSFTVGIGKSDIAEPGDEVSNVDLDVAAMIGDVDTILGSVTFKF